MNILAPLAAGLALAPTAVKAIGGLAQEFSFIKLLSSKASTEAETPKDATGDDIKAQVEEFRRELAERLSLAGVDLSDPLTLGITSWGEIEVRSPHYQAFEIEQMLNSDPQLPQRFYQTAALVSASNEPPQLESETNYDLDQFELTIGS